MEEKVIISLEKRDKNYYDEAYEEKLFRDRHEETRPENISNIKIMIKNIITHQNTILATYEIAQNKLNEALEKITEPIYYSPKRQQIYTLLGISALTSVFTDVYDFKLECHCELLEISHTKVYILNHEIDEMTDLCELRNKFLLINSKFKLREGMTPRDSIVKFFSGN